MLFNSIDFALFLPIVFAIYWMLGKSIRGQNLLILVASYVFYGWWDYRFLALIAFSTLVDYFAGMRIAGSDSNKTRKGFLILSLLTNLGLLGFFKYYNFFVDSFVDAFRLMGTELEASTLNIILPVGISFYTFQTMSYTIDVYRRNMEPSRNFISFAAYVSFFPQLVAGPIERASQLLPQFYEGRKFSFPFAAEGLKYMLWGLFKKMVIADNCAIFANDIFNNHADHSGGTLLLGAIFFAFQIYGDFSGYSDIAIGTARLFGFNLMRNFAYPYFSRDIAEFWRRWHISLSTWFRDYVYIPLGGSRGSTGLKIRNTFIIFLLSGFWHGANWTFIIWGLLHALFFLPVLLMNKNRKNLDIPAGKGILPSLREFWGMLITFFLVVIGWIFFRAETLSQAIEISSGIFSGSLIRISPYFLKSSFYLIVLLGGFVMAEWLSRNYVSPMHALAPNAGKWSRWFIYALVIFLIGMFSPTEETPFIYFQF